MSITREWASGLDFFLLFTEYFSVREHNTYSHIYTSACVYCLALPTGPNPCQSEEVTHLPRSLWSCLYPIFLARDAHTLQDGPASPLRLLNCEAIFWTHIYKRCPLGCKGPRQGACDRGRQILRRGCAYPHSHLQMRKLSSVSKYLEAHTDLIVSDGWGLSILISSLRLHAPFPSSSAPFLSLSPPTLGYAMSPS